MQKVKDRKWMSVLKGIFLSFIVIVCLYLFLGQIFLSYEKDNGQKDCYEFYDGWVWVQEDGERVEIEIPGRCDVERNEPMVIENVLPDDVLDNQFLFLRSSKQEMKIYVDGELRKEYTTADTRPFGKLSAVTFVFVELNSDDAGKTVRIELQTDSSYSGLLNEMYYGDKWEIWSHMFRLHGLELCIGFFMLVLGVATIIISVALRVSYKKGVEMEYLGWGVFLAAIWIISNSVFRQVIFPSISVISDIAFIMVMILPIPFMLYMDSVQNKRYQKLLGVMVALDLIDAVVCVALHVTNTIDYSDSIIVIGAVAGISIGSIIFTMIRDLIKGYIKQYKLVALGVLSICLAAVVQLVIYFSWSNQFNGSVIAITLIFVLIISFVNSMNEVLGMERDKQQAITSNEAKSKFLANMSHEIRTPINAVLGMDEMILRETKDEAIREYAMNIQNAGQTLLAIVNDILDLSKIESGKMEIVSTPYEFSSMLYDVVNMIKIKAEDKGLRMKFIVDNTLPFMLCGDEVRIRQVLINILSNAVKYTPKGSVTFTVAGERDGDNVRLYFAVEDTGIGIKEEDINKLFARFERIEEKRNRNIEGTGLGMNITIQLLQLMGSKLNVESEYGVGSKFYFELEQKIVNDEPIGNLAERMENASAEQKYEVVFEAPNAHILVVDDNAINRKVFINLLKQTKVQIDEAESGMACIDMVQKKHYDIIFLDHMMPELDGIETLAKMKELEDYPCKDVPVIALTANAIQGAKEMYLKEGFDNFISKPIRPDKLESMILELLPKELIVESISNEDAVESDEGKTPAVEGMDWNLAMLHLTSEELLLETIHDFYQTMTSEKDYLIMCYNNLDDEDSLKNYRIKVHAMKSSLAVIGMTELSEKAKALELAAADKNTAFIYENMDTFIEEWDKCKERLTVFIVDDSDKEMADLSLIRGLLGALKTAMEEMDIDAADDMMKSIKSYSYTGEVKEKIEELSTAVVNLDVELVSKIIDEVIEDI